MSNLACRLFGHRRWYYDEEDTGDFVFGCVRCKDPALITDREQAEPVPGQPGYVRIDPEFLRRMSARLEMRL